MAIVFVTFTNCTMVPLYSSESPLIQRVSDVCQSFIILLSVSIDCQSAFLCKEVSNGLFRHFNNIDNRFPYLSECIVKQEKKIY